MKKKLLWGILGSAALLMVLFLPIPKGVIKDGGTREYQALTYKIIQWNRIHADAVYHKTKIYFGKDAYRSVDVLWEREDASKSIYDKRDQPYPEIWMEKKEEDRREDAFVSDVIIGEIYADCFIASPIVPQPYEMKLNGTLSEEWCVGDRVEITFENGYYNDDIRPYRAEGDLLTIKESTFELDPLACYKPVIYLYPKKKQEVMVRLDLNGALTCTYPAYEEGWRVIASPDGTLQDQKGQTYNYLYWEGNLHEEFDLSQGFCIKGAETAAFLEEALAKLGLNRREANEFIVYWLPMMEQNPYNVISFQTERYTDGARLFIDPVPDTLIRVFMAWKGVEEKVDLLPQALSAPKREGFAAIEWGGTEIKP